MGEVLAVDAGACWLGFLGGSECTCVCMSLCGCKCGCKCECGLWFFDFVHKGEYVVDLIFFCGSRLRTA